MNYRTYAPFFATTEGRLLLVGLTLAMLMVLVFGLAWYLDLAPDRMVDYAAITGLNLTIGRAAGMSFGYARGLVNSQVISLNMLIETIQVLVVYPLFVLSWRQLINVKALQSFVTRMHQAAGSRSDTVRRFGIVGLFLFVFIPFWMTGPVVGAIIGFLIGLRPWVIVTVVLISTYIAIALWALPLSDLSLWAATIDPDAPYALFGVIVLIAVVFHLGYRNTPRK